jgi:hypothetical protein
MSEVKWLRKLVLGMVERTAQTKRVWMVGYVVACFMVTVFSLAICSVFSGTMAIVLSGLCGVFGLTIVGGIYDLIRRIECFEQYLSLAVSACLSADDAMRNEHNYCEVLAVRPWVIWCIDLVWFRSNYYPRWIFLGPTIAQIDEGMDLYVKRVRARATSGEDVLTSDD